MIGRALALSVIVMTLVGWVGRMAHAAPAFTLPAYTNEGVAVNDFVSTYANFDGGGRNYSGTALALAGVRSGSPFMYRGAFFQLPRFYETSKDNWTAPTTTPITIPITASAGSAIAFLGSSTLGPSSGTATLTFSDSTTLTFTLALSDWTLGAGTQPLAPGNSIAATMGYQDTNDTYERAGASYLFFDAPVTVPAGESLVSLTLPASVNHGVIHVFSVAAIAPKPPYTNEGVSATDGVANPANFDGAGDSYSETALYAALGGSPRQPEASATSGGLVFGLPPVGDGVNDNWRYAGQVVPAPGSAKGLLGFVGAAAGGASTGQVTVTYTNGVTQTATITLSDWTLDNGTSSPASGDTTVATMSYQNTATGGARAVKTYLFMATISLMANATPLSVTLPSTVSGGAMHIFTLAIAPTPPLSPKPIPTPPVFGANDWTGYLHDTSHDSFDSAETALTTATFPQLKKAWSTTAGGVVSDQPAIVNGVSYWGSWDGSLHATSATGASLWATNLGVTTDSACDPASAGVASSPAMGAVDGVTSVFVAGGDSRFYAVNAATGAIEWSTLLGKSPSYFLWSSPLVYNGAIYEGIASFGDCPLIQGAVAKLDENTGVVLDVLHLTPVSCTGVSVWGAISVDPATNTLYFGTGNAGSCASPEPLAESVIAASATDLSLISSWQIPNQATGGDIDFGTTPTLFTATISGQSRAMLGIVNKDGAYFGFDRTNIGAGPIWTTQIGTGGDCPQCGTGDISPGAFDGARLYVGSGNTTINNVSCPGSVRALNPATGAILWQNCLGVGPVLGALTTTPGVVVATSSTEIFAFNAASGALLWNFVDTTPGAQFYGPAAVSNGRLYVGSVDAIFYVFSINGATARPRGGSPQRHTKSSSQT